MNKILPFRNLRIFWSGSMLTLLLTTYSCTAQEQNSTDITVGGPCEGCEALYEYGDRHLTATETLLGYEDNEPKIKLTGIVYQSDGKTPAKDIIIYIYHTNTEGIYETKGDEEGWAKRHGYIRGWVKTNENGIYTINTFRPGSYPNRRTPAHIHMTIKEPGKIPYYIDEVLFSDDPLLTETFIKDLPNRGGSGLSTPLKKDGILIITRDITLGENIPDYH